MAQDRVRNPKVDRELTQFYRGKVCVVTGCEHPPTNHWAHVNEKRSDTRFENMIPLRADLNHVFEQQRKFSKPAKRRAPVTWPLELELSYLESVSREHFKYGRHAHGYGSVLLASYIARHYHQDYSAAMRFCAYALDHLRALGRYDLISKTLTEYVLNPNHSADSYSRGRLAVSVASMYQDIADLKQYASWSELAKKLLSADGNRPRSSRELNRLKWKDIATDVAEGCDPTRALESMEGAQDEAPFVDWNRRQWEARYALRQGNKLAARKVLEKLRACGIARINSSELGGRVSVWTYAELLITCAQLEGDAGAADGILSLAWECFKLHRILPTKLDSIDHVIIQFQDRHILLEDLRVQTRPDALDKNLDGIVENDLKGMLSSGVQHRSR